MGIRHDNAKEVDSLHIFEEPKAMGILSQVHLCGKKDYYG